MVKGMCGVASLTLEPQQASCSSSDGRLELMPTGPMMSASRLSFVSRHCSISRPFLFRHTRLNVRFLPIPGEKTAPPPPRRQTEIVIDVIC